MASDNYESLARRGGDWSILVDNLRRIEECIETIQFAPFFEPVSGLETTKGQSGTRLAAITAAHLTAWTRHVGYGTIARLQTLTAPCLALLKDDQFVIAGLIERCALEHAARAAHALDELRDGYQRRSWEALRESIPRTLFGTCLTKTEGTLFENLSEVDPQRPIKPSKLIHSLEAFAGMSSTSGQSFFPGLYGYLCDLTHASQRANGTLCDVLEANGSGWVLEYHRVENKNEDASLGALRGMMRCLQAGYGAGAMLLAWSFDDEAPMCVAGAPTRSDWTWIWDNILNPEMVFW